jgi:hypothetical protein
VSEDIEALKKRLEDFRESGGDPFQVGLIDLLIKLCESVDQQAEIIKSVMVVADAAVSLNRMHNDRITALEERARGLSMQDIVDGREPTPLGPTQAHYQELMRINADLGKLTGRTGDS